MSVAALEHIVTAPLLLDPGPHVIVPDVLAAERYAELVNALPLPTEFEVADKYKSNFDPATSPGTSKGSLAWRLFEQMAIIDILAPLLAARFSQVLDTEGARAFRGRLMLRRPGYNLKPHRDTKAAVITGLIYFARPGDSQEFGTDLYRVDHDVPAPSTKTFYPAQEGGATVTLVKSVPFVGNTLLAFANVEGMAHGAAIPKDSTQRERYAYQFYVGRE